MKSFILLLSIFFSIQSYNAQRVRWPSEVSGSNANPGIYWIFKYGFYSYAIAPKQEEKENSDPKSNKKNEPAELTFKYHDLFDAQQLCVVENYNPGAITKIEIGYSLEKKSSLIYKTIYEGEAKAKPKEFTINHYFFDMLPNISEVKIYMDYMSVEGVNQLGGVVLTDFKEPFKPGINLPEKEVFTSNVIDMNDDVNGTKTPAGIVASADGKIIYFTHEINQDQLFEGHIGKDGTFSKVQLSRFNLPHEKSTSSGIVGVSQDNNEAYISANDVSEFNFYKVFQNKKGKWIYKKEILPGYSIDTKGSKRVNYLMSYDGNTIILSYEDKKLGKTFGQDMYVSRRSPNGKWSTLKRMSDDINTIHNEIPSYIAPDNKTLFFASNGHYGYGSYDLFMSKRLDDTWLNWSYPINLGPVMNSKGLEDYITFDLYNNLAYFVRGNDLFRIELEKPETIDTNKNASKTIDVEPTILIEGIVTDKKTGKPIQAEIYYHNIQTKELLGVATSNFESGKYSIILQKGIDFSFESSAKNYLSESYNLNLTDLKNADVFNKNFELISIEKGETLRLNNIFFETAKSELKEESYLELNKIVDFLSKNKKVKIEIQGHTDNVGKADYNLKLSNDRAKSVVDYLISQSIDSSRLVYKGYGETSPVAENTTEEGKAYNRRVEMKILEN